MAFPENLADNARQMAYHGGHNHLHSWIGNLMLTLNIQTRNGNRIQPSATKATNSRFVVPCTRNADTFYTASGIPTTSLISHADGCVGQHALNPWNKRFRSFGTGATLTRRHGSKRAEVRYVNGVSVLVLLNEEPDAKAPEDGRVAFYAEAGATAKARGLAGLAGRPVWNQAFKTFGGGLGPHLRPSEMTLWQMAPLAVVETVRDGELEASTTEFEFVPQPANPVVLEYYDTAGVFAAERVGKTNIPPVKWNAAFVSFGGTLQSPVARISTEWEVVEKHHGNPFKEAHAFYAAKGLTVLPECYEPVIWNKAFQAFGRTSL
ncbi:hypothetical protein BC830DRAFT_1076559 [Chytriomyces sp. MP71]|nr:hypothetical protein BC830DRAFT_1076559 [Chytriomyces sp. MP71]